MHTHLASSVPQRMIFDGDDIHSLPQGKVPGDLHQQFVWQLRQQVHLAVVELQK